MEIRSKKRTYLVVLLLLLSSRFIYAQIAANPNSGCAPLVGVAFTGVPGSTGIIWNFGDGSSSPQLNPQHTFNTSGTYTVTYSAMVGGSPVNQSLVVNVYGKPHPNFSAPLPRNGCAPLSVTFNDNSIGGGGTAITSWQWAFGDGGINNSSGNPTYSYTQSGQFNVSVKVTDANGCDSSMVITNYITVSTKPIIILSPNPMQACLPPLTVNFGSSLAFSGSPIGPALTYSWNLGNGNTSTQLIPPAQTYTTSGVFPVTFIVTDNNNCSDSVKKNITIQNPFSSFSVNDTVCKTTSFTSNSTGGSVYNWNFGDGQSSGLQNPTHTYANTGNYNVTLTVLNGVCFDDSVRTIYVEEPNPNFTINPGYMCSLPTMVNLSNTTPGSNTYYWTFNETATHYEVAPDSSFLQNPSFTITDLDTNRYTINGQDIFIKVTLVATSSHGCKDSIVKTLVDTVYLPTARFMPDKVEGCAPLTVQFSDSSRSKETIVSWQYFFGDGATANTQNSTHTYTQAGIYYATLVIVNANGCTDTSYAITIKVGLPPTPDFSVSLTSVCIGDSISFTDLTPATDSVDTWHYSTDGGYYMSHCYGDPNPTWAFGNTTGPQNVTLTACERGCCSSVTKPNLITVKGPLAKLSVSMDCDSSHVYQFTADMSDATTWDWDFGDGTVINGSTATNLSHTYPSNTDYIAVVKAYNATSGCSPSSDTILIHVRDIKAMIVADTAICTGVPVSFDATASQDVYPYNNNGYVWLWGDGSHPDITDQPTVTHSYSSGFHAFTLIVKDINGCHDTARYNTRAYDLIPGFTIDQIFLCKTDTLFFTNTSTADTTISNYLWSFGDGTNSTATDTSHIFNLTTQSTVTVTLQVTTVLGCTKQVSKVLTVSYPNAAFSVTGNSNICAGDSVKFNMPVNYPGINWNFGDGGTASNTQTPSHFYTSSGTFPVIALVTDSIGCTDADTLNNLVKVQAIPQVIISSPADTASSICYPYQAQFTDNSIASIFFNRVWNLGTGQPVNNLLSTVGTIYQTPGTYTITLDVYTTFGCHSQGTKTLVVNGPLADFSVSTDTICKGQSIGFNIKDSTDVFTWHWDFGDGLDTTATSPISHQFDFHPPGGSTNVTLIYWSADSSCAQTRSYPIYIRQVIADFNRNNELGLSDTAHCIGLSDQFTNTSIGGDTYGWNFGDGTNGSVNNPVHTFLTVDTFNVSINIHNNATGCNDTITKEMIVYPTPLASSVGDSACKDSALVISASGAGTGGSYSWSPATGLSCTNCASPVATLTTTTTYTVIITDAHGCRDTTNVIAFVQQPPPHVVFDTSIVIGQTAVLNYPFISGLSYQWDPIDYLSCSTCPNPTTSTLVDMHYDLNVTDNLGCYNEKSLYDIHILPVSSLDVPSAFTPNGDGVNDIVYVDGWGIKKLLYFRIYNRWGELVFESTDIHVGWDGTYKGVPQNVETYVYQASGDTYIDEKPVTKKGYVKLIR
ncbi:MAG: PKD domain-containing protein [Bacteroidia bacterium]